MNKNASVVSYSQPRAVPRPRAATLTTEGTPHCSHQKSPTVSTFIHYTLFDGKLWMAILHSTHYNNINVENASADAEVSPLRKWRWKQKKKKHNAKNIRHFVHFVLKFMTRKVEWNVNCLERRCQNKESYADIADSVFAANASQI